jgi:hypothetical protein
MRFYLLFCVLLIFAGGCATEAHRRVGEGVRNRTEKIAANEEVPEEARQAAAEATAGMECLQKRVLPKPKSAVVGTSEELKADIAKAGSFDSMVFSFKRIGKTILDRLASKEGLIGALFTGIVGLGGLLVKVKKYAGKAIEVRNRVASTYREKVPEKLQAVIDAKLSEVAERFNLPPEEVAKFLVWENTPD